ncbi:MAG: hypothetical protein VX346_28980 [Planctomycetota bacterium]|nr:hypothetical protein [Planctomycetota bacterium]
MARSPMPLWKFFAGLVLVEGLLVTTIVLVLRYAPEIANVFIAVATFAGVAGICRAAFTLIYNPMMESFPQQTIPPYATQRSYQTFSFGSVNMALSIHVAVDEQHLHLTPIMPWRWLGATAVSIPWAAMVPGRAANVVTVDGWNMVGPKWCLEKAAGAPTGSDQP